jgi:glycosyltransferase involved in cell wall biosynthesis
LKILYHHRIASKDGQYVHVEELVRALERLGHEIVMAAPAAVERGRLGYTARPIAHLKRWVPRGIYELMEYLYSVVDFRRLSAAARRHSPDCLYERYNLFLPSGVWLKRRTGLPMLLEVNAPLWEERSRYGGIYLNRLARSTQSKSWRSADFVLPVTEVLAGYVRRAGVPASRIVVIPNGADPERFDGVPGSEEAKHRLALRGKLVLGFTGFVREWHGLERVLDYVSKKRSGEGGELHLLVVGDGPAVEGLRAHAARLGIEDRVTVTGVVERDSVASHIAAFDVALQPAVVEYASPLKLFEYLALGCAIVAPSMANIREILTHERDALLFDPAEPAALERALDRLCSDASLRARLGSAARHLVDERGLTWENNARRVVDLFRQLGVEDHVPTRPGVAASAIHDRNIS